MLPCALLSARYRCIHAFLLSQTYKPERQLPAGSKASALHQTMQATMKATLGGGELQNTVKLPPGEDLNEWIAVNTGEALAAATVAVAAALCAAANCHPLHLLTRSLWISPSSDCVFLVHFFNAASSDTGTDPACISVEACCCPTRFQR